MFNVIETNRAILLTIFCCVASCATVIAGEDGQSHYQEEVKGLDLVSDTVALVFNKANAILTGNLDIDMSKDRQNTEGQYIRNAIGQKVPASTAVKSAGSLHNDEPL
ncbi:MAG: hypothetical protein NC938_02100 [Candidatus Omnitrophica bacterium]|nr:hypothetical protein [Candidatus Omnitrophota bacterium]